MMQQPIIITQFKGILLLVGILASTNLLSQITVDQFMGVNTRGEDPIERMQAVGFIREYHPWYYNEGNPTPNGEGFSPTYPNAIYRWNTAYPGTTFAQLDEFYQNAVAAGLTINPTFLGNLFQIVDPTITGYTSENGKIQEQQPRVPTDDPLSPASYIAHGAYLYHYAARYGQTNFSTNRFNSIIKPVTHPQETPLTGLGRIQYMESWNEQDKTWWQAEYPATYFSPEVYSAMLSADFDGHNQTLGLVQDPDDSNQMISTVGIKNADPNMKVVVGGLATANLDYFRDMVTWSKTNRPANAAHGQIPFDVLNIHHYVGNGPDFNSHTFGISPEAANLQPFLKTFDNYRDSLNAAEGLDLELWLSEFGYDTYDNPPCEGCPLTNQTIVAPPIGNNDNYEVQGQWLVRTYLAALAADIDRAMMYDLRDVIGQQGLFAKSGLLEDVANNYKPKNSWFYVYTMKNVLTEMVFDEAITLNPSQVVDPGNIGYADSTYVYKFKDPNGGNKTVYAIWSGTSSDKSYDINFNLEDATGSTLVQLELPSIWGVPSAITTATPAITISERPVFLVLNDTYFTPQGSCTTTAVAENPTCSSMNIRLNVPHNSGTYQLWHMEGGFPAQDFSHRLSTLVDESITPGDSVITVGNLKADTYYTFYLIPEGVGKSETAKICTTINTTLAATSTCYIDVQSSWIYDGFRNDLPGLGIHPYTLFDEQAYGDSICAPTDTLPTSLWGVNDSITLERSVSIDLQAHYYIDLFTIHDQFSEGFFTIQTAESPNGPWTTAAVYQTVETNAWSQITNAIPSHTPIRYLKFIAEKENKAKVGELLICGRLSNFNPDIIPGVATNGDITCDTTQLSWNHPFDDDIFGYKVIDTDNQTIIDTAEYVVGTQGFQIPNNLNVSRFSIVTLDNAYQESTDTLKISSSSLERVSDCQIPLNISMIFDHFNDINNAYRLVDEQSGYDPICDPSIVPTSNFWGLDYPDNGTKEHVSLNLGAYYNIDQIVMHDGVGQNGHVDIFMAASPNGPWTNIVSHDAVLNGWATFNAPIPNNDPVKYLRFEASIDNQVNVGELFICGTLNPSYNPTILPGTGTNGQVTALTCNEVSLSWMAPFDDNIAKYLVFSEGNLVGMTTTNSLMLNSLTANTAYSFKIVTEDNDGNESTDSLTIAVTTNMDGECNLVCNVTCSCAICVRPSWITSLNTNTNYSKDALFDEQDKVPFCGATNLPFPNSFYSNNSTPGSGNAPDTVVIDLQKVYDISAIRLFFQGGSGNSYIVQYLNSGNVWTEIINIVPDYGWDVFSNLGVRAQHLRIIQTDNNLAIGEMGICGTEYVNLQCPTTLDMTAAISQADTFTAGAITSNAILSSGIEVGFFAENSITLTTGFHAVAGSDFLAKIAACPADNVTSSAIPIFANTYLPVSTVQLQTTLTVYPNPFQSSTTLAFDLIQPAPVQLTIFDATGSMVKKLIHNQFMDHGQHEILFNTEGVDNGFYMARLQVGSEVLLKKMVLLGR